MCHGFSCGRQEKNQDNLGPKVEKLRLTLVTLVKKLQTFSTVSNKVLPDGVAHLLSGRFSFYSLPFFFVRNSHGPEAAQTRASVSVGDVGGQRRLRRMIKMSEGLFQPCGVVALSLTALSLSFLDRYPEQAAACPSLSFYVLACPSMSLPVPLCPCLSLYVPACPSMSLYVPPVETAAGLEGLGGEATSTSMFSKLLHVVKLLACV